MAKNRVRESHQLVDSPVEQEAVVVSEPVETPVAPKPVEEVVKPQVTQPAPSVSKSEGDVSEIKQILENPSLTMAEKVKLIATSKTDSTRFATVMVDYNNAVGKNAPQPTESQGASLNYNLYTRLVKILKTEDYNEFKAMFDVVNFIFEIYKDDAFSEYNLHRFDTKWSWGEKQLKTYQVLVTTICTLCDRSKRKATLATNFSFTQLFNRERTVFTDKMIENIRKYYEG